MRYKTIIGLFFVLLLVGSVSAVSDELRQKDALKEQERLELQINNTLEPPLKAGENNQNQVKTTTSANNGEYTGSGFFAVKKGGFVDTVKGWFVKSDSPVIKRQVEEKFLGMFKMTREVSYQEGARKAGIWDFLYTDVKQ